MDAGPRVDRPDSARRCLRGGRRNDRALLDGGAVVGDPVRNAMQMRAERFGRQVAHADEEAGGSPAGSDASRGVRSTMIPSGTAQRARTTASHADGLTYIMPISSAAPAARDDLAAYLRWLAERAETIVVDGSPSVIFAAHSAAWAGAIDAGLRHVAPAADLATEMGKVGGVLTGLRLASHARVIVADDDVRYDEATLAAVAAALDTPTSSARRTTSSRFRGTRAGTPAACC